MESQKITIQYLIDAIEYFQKNQGKYFYNNTPRKVIDLLIFEEIKTIKGYNSIRQTDFDKFLPENKIALLKKTVQEDVSATVPQNIQVLVDELQKHEAKPQGEPDYRWIASLKKKVEIATEKDEEVRKIFETQEELSRDNGELNKQLVFETEPETTQINEINNIASEYIDNISISDPTPLVINIPVVRKKLKEKQPLVLNEIVIETPKKEKETEIPVYESQPSGFLATPIGRKIVGYGVDKLAEEDPVTAIAIKTAKQISVNTKALEDAGVNHTLVKLFKDRMTAFVGPDGEYPDILEQYIAGQGLLNDHEINVLSKVQAGAVNLATYNEAFVPVQGNIVSNLVNRAGRQVLGGISKNLIKKSLGIGGKGIVKEAAAAAGASTGPIGSVLAWLGTEFVSRIGPLIKRFIVPVFAAAGGILLFIPFGIPGAIVGGVGGAAAAGGITGGSISAGVATVGAGVAALGGAFIGTLVVPFIVAIVGIPIVVAFVLFIINSGAYVVPPAGTAFLGSPGPAGIVCNTTNQTYASTAANAAACIVADLNQFNLNPLFPNLLNTPDWNSLAKVLPQPAVYALYFSTKNTGHLQCVGFTSATAGLAYGQADAPSGYTYVAGTSGIRSGDFFLKYSWSDDGSKQYPCTDSTPGHIGVVTSVDGALIGCADANYIADGKARIANSCFPLSVLAGYLRKQ